MSKKSICRRRLLSVVALLFALPSGLQADEALVYSTDFLTGYYSSMQVQPPHAPLVNIESTCSDAVARWSGGLVYLLGRFGCDFIQVVDPGNGFATVGQFSTGNGTNPQDIEVYAPDKAYVSLYETDYILIINPQNGQHLGQISLAEFSDSDGLPETAEMVRIGNRLFVALQRLDRPGGFIAANPGLLAVIDCETDQLVDVDPNSGGIQGIALSGRNPFSELVFDTVRKKILVVQTGDFGVQDGGAEYVDPQSLQAEGFFVTETELGGDLNSMRLWVDCSGYSIVTDASYNTRLVRFDRCSGEVVAVCMESSGFSLSDFEIDCNGTLLVADRDLVTPGVHVFELPGCNPVTTSPVSFGLPPQDIALVGNCLPTAVGTVPTGTPRIVQLLPNWPDPFNPRTTLRFHTSPGIPAVLEVMDVRGRRLTVVWQGISAGEQEIQWHARDAAGSPLPSGTYFARLRTATTTSVERMTLVR